MQTHRPRERSTRNKVLLTSVCRPFGGPGEGDSVGAELFHAQVTRAQGAFGPRQVIRVWAIDYVAENIDAPAVTLHYPSFDELERELRGSDYTHVGINFVVATFHKVKRMVALIRRHLPNATIVLGGYGTVLPDELLEPHGDAICREEGVGFMRRLLGEPEATRIRAPHAPIPSPSFLSVQQNSVVGHVTAGLGCPNGCDFCCTSHFFKRRYVRLCQSGRDIYEQLLATRARARADGFDMSSFIIIDEDFFLHHKRARQFLDCVREGGEALSLMGFGSVRGLSKFTAEEIAEMGFDIIWNAFEGTDAGYGKQRGRPLPELYADLKSVGCGQLTSMIIGFPYQDEARMRVEFEQLMQLEPAMTQCLIYFAFPGTPFHEQVVAEGRYRERYRNEPDLRRWDGFAMHFEHPKFDDPGRIEALQHELYREDFERLGPSLLRFARVWLEGYLNLRGHHNTLLAKRAERLRELARSTLPMLRPAIEVAASDAARERLQVLRRDLITHTGELTTRDKIYDIAAPILRRVSDGLARAGLLQQPGLLRVEYRLPGAAASQHTGRVLGLQGGRTHATLRALREDLTRHARRLLSPTEQPWGAGETDPVTRAAPLGASRLPAAAAPSETEELPPAAVAAAAAVVSG